MGVWQAADNSIVIRHPGLTGQWWDESLQLPQLEYSLEFATFLNRWNLGHRDNTSFDKNNFRITQRKSAYGAHLINFVGHLSQSGQVIANDLRTIFKRLIYFSQQTNETIPDLTDPQNYQDIHHLDRIILNGRFTDKHLGFLKILNFFHEGQADLRKTDITLQNFRFETLTYENQIYLHTAWFRGKASQRQSFEHLVKHSLVYLKDLPKALVDRRQGRQPVGAYISPGGLRFFELYCKQYDPQMAVQDQQDRFIQRMREEE